MHLPNDADGDALRRLAAAGSDLSRPMSIDFAVAVPSRVAGLAVARAAAVVGYESSVDGGGDGWTCYCTRRMVASHAAVVDAQAELNRLSEPHGGRCDGWGSAGN
jgi:regulator of RNase E activity RraB